MDYRPEGLRQMDEVLKNSELNGSGWFFVGYTQILVQTLANVVMRGMHYQELPTANLS